MFDVNKLDNESELQYIWRICFAKDSGTLDLTWDDLANILNTNLKDDESDYLSSSAYRKKYQYSKEMYDEVFSKMISNEYSDDITIKNRELKKERAKLQSEKLEYNRWLREEARDELILEKICDAINTLPPLDIPRNINIVNTTKSYALCFGDEHYGSEFHIKGLYGETINEYNPEIFEERMSYLLSKTVEFINKEKIDTLYVFNLGDFSDGILRVSQLMKLRYGIIDGTIRYAHYISNWLNELTKHVNVKFQMTDGNHTELRQLGQPKGTFTQDNAGKIVREFIKIRLENNPNFTLIENPTGYIYANLSNNIILGIHGEVKNMAHAINDFSKMYNTKIDYLIGGHMHHYKSEEVGVRSEVINIPSVIGVDDYSLSLMKTSDASAKILVFDQLDGLIMDYRIKLN